MTVFLRELVKIYEVRMCFFERTRKRRRGCYMLQGRRRRRLCFGDPAGMIR